mmetsp:Transcript_49201/g.73155  ORF Transcript_49201/g.73155 Transcript_49201/m.73155 type:complete len:204 (+) Transcript_49201:2222-2833(+)
MACTQLLPLCLDRSTGHALAVQQINFTLLVLASESFQLLHTGFFVGALLQSDVLNVNTADDDLLFRGFGTELIHKVRENVFVFVAQGSQLLHQGRRTDVVRVVGLRDGCIDVQQYVSTRRRLRTGGRRLLGATFRFGGTAVLGLGMAAVFGLRVPSLLGLTPVLLHRGRDLVFLQKRFRIATAGVIVTGVQLQVRTSWVLRLS